MKQTYKHGDFVTCKINGVKIKDARISIDGDGTPFICQNKEDGISAKDKLGYKFSWRLYRDFGHTNVTDLKLAKKTLKNLEVGDIIENQYGRKMVLGICGRVIFLSSYDDYSEVENFHYTIKRLEGYGYKPVDQPGEPIKRMTKSEIEKELGYKIKIIKEK